MFFLVFLVSFLFADVPHQSDLLGYSVTGRPIYVDVLGDGDENILLVGGVHGNEWVGTPLLFGLQKFIHTHPKLIEGKRVYILPMLNPDGWIDNMRSNRRRVDLNRNFPSHNYGRGLTGEHPLSEPESKILDELLQKIQPGRIISLHQPFSCIDYDGEGIYDLVQILSQSTRLPICKLGSRSGSLGAYISKKYPLITIEFPYDVQYKSMSYLWKKYGESMVQSVAYPNKFPFKNLAEIPSSEYKTGKKE